jgi:hypothetical protein
MVPGAYVRACQPNCDRLAGALPPRAADLVREWAGLHRAELEANWERARREQALEAIEPLPCDDGMEQLVDITGVEVVRDHRLRLTFADGTAGEVDFAERAWDGVLAPLSDPAFFARVYVDEEARRGSRHDRVVRRDRPRP